MVCTIIDIDIRHYRGQTIVNSQIGQSDCDVTSNCGKIFNFLNIKWNSRRIVKICVKHFFLVCLLLVS